MAMHGCHSQDGTVYSFKGLGFGWTSNHSGTMVYGNCTRVVAGSTSPGEAMVENKRVNTQSFKEKELSSSSNFQPGHEV